MIFPDELDNELFTGNESFAVIGELKVSGNSFLLVNKENRKIRKEPKIKKHEPIISLLALISSTKP